jgi:hypothetical protein
MAEVATHRLGNNKDASKLIGDLYKAIHNTGDALLLPKRSTRTSKSARHLLRVNSGGTVLSYSDLLLSIATAQWAERDARQSIHSLVDELNALGQVFASQRM